MNFDACGDINLDNIAVGRYTLREYSCKQIYTCLMLYNLISHTLWFSYVLILGMQLKPSCVVNSKFQTEYVVGNNFTMEICDLL